MKERLFKALDNSYKISKRSFKFLQPNILIQSDDNIVIEYLEQWCNEKEFQLLKLDFNDIKYFSKNDFYLPDSKEVVICRVVYDKVNEEPQTVNYTPQEYQDYLEANEKNYLMYKDGNELVLNKKFDNEFNNGNVVLLITGMENHYNNSFNSNKRRIILDFIRKPPYNSLIFSVCIIPNNIDVTDWYHLTCYDGKDQFITRQICFDKK